MHVQKCSHVHLSCNTSTLTSTGPASCYDDICMQYGWSSLHTARDEGHLDIVKTLIEAGANVNQAVCNRLHVAFNVIVIY